MIDFCLKSFRFLQTKTNRLIPNGLTRNYFNKVEDSLDR